MLTKNSYEEIENAIENNVAIHWAKEYSINKNDIDTFYLIGRILYINKMDNEEKIEKLGQKLTASLEVYVPKDTLVTSLKFYKFVNLGMIKSYKVKWDDYEILLNINDINEINDKIMEIYNILPPEIEKED